MELIEKIFSLRKKLGEKMKQDLTKNNMYNLEDTLEEKTINDVSFYDYSILRDNYGKGMNIINIRNINNKINGKNFIENKIIKVNKHQINFFKAELINKVKNGK